MENDRTKIFIFAGGGTGGHLYPGLAVAEKLVALDPGAQPVFACSDRPIDTRILSQTKFSFFTQPIKPISKSPSRWPAMIAGWCKSKMMAKTVLADLQPSAVLGLGGFAAGAMCKTAVNCGISTAMLNPDAIPGKANKFLARVVDKIFTQFENTGDFFPDDCRRKITVAGCPVRPGLTGGNRSEAIKFFDLDNDKMTLLVFGGSALAESIILAMEKLATDLAPLSDSWQVIMPTGKKYAQQIAEAFNKNRVKIAMPEYCKNMEMAYAAADIALCRGGAGTVAELSATATPAVILPYPYHTDRQQYLNSADLERQGSAVIMDDLIEPELNAASLKKTLLEIIKDADKLQAMTKAAKQHAKTNAAEIVARWLMEQAS